MKKFKFLGSLFIWLIWLISFWYCEYLWLDFITAWNRIEIPAWWTSVQVNLSDLSNWTAITKWMPYCMHYRITRLSNWNYVNATSNAFSFIFSIWPVSDYYWWFTKIRFVPWNWMNQWFVCWFVISQWTLSYLTWNFTEQGNSYSIYVDYEIYKNNWFVDPGWSCTNYTSEECQQEYSLMPITSCNSEYCWLNWLCPEYTGSTMSELYINWINHLSAPVINLLIPLEYQWDYEYTWDVMNINLSWENNVDYEYIDNIIRTQKSIPDSSDFENIITNLVPLFVPWLVIILFLIFIFRFIKKIF